MLKGRKTGNKKRDRLPMTAWPLTSTLRRMMMMIAAQSN